MRGRSSASPGTLYIRKARIVRAFPPWGCRQDFHGFGVRNPVQATESPGFLAPHQGVDPALDTDSPLKLGFAESYSTAPLGTGFAAPRPRSAQFTPG